MHETLKKFGYPDSLVKAYEHWLVLVRPEQVTLGSMIIFEKNGLHRYSNIPESSHREFGKVVKDVEKVLHDEFRYDKMNYLMLMMVDPEVHYHAIPRYGEERSFHGLAFQDHGWPAMPNLGQVNQVSDNTFTNLVLTLKERLDSVPE
ncbi:HIT family protein [Candidatus Neomarinimicrobiota bacterium]